MLSLFASCVISGCLAVALLQVRHVTFVCAASVQGRSGGSFVLPLLRCLTALGSRERW
jgi:hypothetical protein